MPNKTSGLRPTGSEFVPKPAAREFVPQPAAREFVPKSAASSEFVWNPHASEGEPKPVANQLAPQTDASDSVPKSAASKGVPTSTAREGVLKPAAREFVPKFAASEFEPRIVAREFVPKSAASQPTSGTGYTPAAEEDAGSQQHAQGARRISEGDEEAFEGGMGQAYCGRPYYGHPFSEHWHGWDESRGLLWGAGDDAWDGEGWEQGYGLWNENAQSTAWQEGGWEADRTWWDGGYLTDEGPSQGPPMSGMGGDGDTAQQWCVGREPRGQGNPEAEQAEPQISGSSSWGANTDGGICCQWGRGRGRGRSVGATRGGGARRGRGRRPGAFVGMARTCEKLQPEQAAELLGILFPGYCKDAIAALLAANNGRVVDCVQELHLIERETMGGSKSDSLDMDLDGFAGEAHAGRAGPRPSGKAGYRQVEHVALDNESAFPALSCTSSTGKDGSGGSEFCSSSLAEKGDGRDIGHCSSSAVASGKELLREEGGSAAAHRGAWVEAAKQGASKAVGVQQEQQQQKRQLLLQQRLRPLSSSAAPAGQRARASTSAAAEVRALACTQHVPWVETGDAVSKQYADARSEARDWCRLRNHCFQQATLAYCNGNKALAKELSIKGRSAADKMWEAHASAADTILAARNAKHRESRASMYQTSCGAHPHFVDLHGLHVQEALAVIAQYMEEGTSTSAAGQRGNVLRVCVGTGHHTMGPTANASRLAAAVVNALREWGVQFRMLQPGLLEVLL